MADYSTLFRDHVALKCRSIDRIFLQAYVPKLQSVGLVCKFLRWQKGYPIPSSAAIGKIGDKYRKAVERFAEGNGTPIVHFQKGENNEELALTNIAYTLQVGRAALNERLAVADLQQKAVWLDLFGQELDNSSA